MGDGRSDGLTADLGVRSMRPDEVIRTADGRRLDRPEVLSGAGATP